MTAKQATKRKAPTTPDLEAHAAKVKSKGETESQARQRLGRRPLTGITIDKAASVQPPVRSTSQYYLVGADADGKEKRDQLAKGQELHALLRNNDGTAAAVAFLHPAGIQVWREGILRATVGTIGELYTFAESQGW